MGFLVATDLRSLFGVAAFFSRCGLLARDRRCVDRVELAIDRMPQPVGAAEQGLELATPRDTDAPIGVRRGDADRDDLASPLPGLVDHVFDELSKLVGIDRHAREA